VVAALALPAGATAAGLSLGPGDLNEQRTVRVLAPGLAWTKIRRGDPGTERWRVNMLELDPGRGPRLGVVLSNGRVRGREPLAGIARRTGALAAVNGGFFAYANYSNGDPVGALVSHGRLVSETVDGRPALILFRDPGRRAQVARLGFKGRVRVGGGSRELDGVNRPAGFIPGCGGRGGDRPTERPDPVVMCTDPSELVLMTRDFGRRTPPREGSVEAVVRGGQVEAIERGGGIRIPSGARVVTGIGSAARFLANRAHVGQPLAVRARLMRGDEALDLGQVEAIVSGDPLLVRRGRRPPIEVAPRKARTLAGVMTDGRLLVVTVDGGARSAGATLRESARLMRGLGARDALSLDSGGSTTMTIGERTVNDPSDGSPRGISDALVVTP
jgi:phosphodiester glycosidase